MDLLRRASPWGLSLLRLPHYKDQTLIDHYIYPSHIPPVVTIPLVQHKGRSAKPCVRVGEKVRLGQKIAEANGDDSLPVHASVSGEVRNIGFYPQPFLGVAEAIEIRSDGQDKLDSTIAPRKDADRLSAGEIVNIIQEAGVAELDEVGTPLHQKLKRAKEAGVETLIVNGCESEPFVTSLHVLMMNKSAEILRGILLAQKISGAKRVIIAIEENKMNALEVLGSKMYSMNLNQFELRALPSRYPQGNPAALVSTLLRRPMADAIEPLGIGTVVIEMATLFAASEAVYAGKPLFERVVTVAGQAVAKPKNMLIRIGSSAEFVIGQCAGMLREPRRVVLAGPMKGGAQATLSVPVTKQTSAVLALIDEAAVPEAPAPCIRCSLCSENCPSGILPDIITLAAEQGEFEIARDFNISLCIECGNCTYVCPSHRPMRSLIEFARAGALNL